MTNPQVFNLDRFGLSHPGHEPEGPDRCEGCGETDVDKDGWCPRCNEQFGDRDKQREDLAPLA